MPDGHLFVISAPSGAGKTTLVKSLIDYTDQLQTSISFTTRPKREGEVDGKDYHFVNKDTFFTRRDNGDFLEYATVFDNYYGTSKSALSDTLSQGIDVMLEIDWQGAEQVKKSFPDSTGIFIVPPSRAILLERLQNRGTDSDAVIQRRTAEAITEISHYPEFDYLVINDNFDTALMETQSIILSFRLKTPRQTKNHSGLLDDLLE